LQSVRHTARPSEDRLEFEPLIPPSSVRLLRPDEVPVHDDRDKILEEVAAGQRARFVAGYVLSDTGREGYTAYAEINVHAPLLWYLFRDLVTRLLPEHAALLIGVKDEELHHCPYRLKAALLTALEPYGEALASERGWLFDAEDSTRWVVLRDSVTAAIGALAGGAAPCVRDQPFGNGGRLTAWGLTDYDASVVRFELVPGGLGAYQLQAGVIAGHPVCQASPEPAA
jgi:hypothetical protein